MCSGGDSTNPEVAESWWDLKALWTQCLTPERQPDVDTGKKGMFGELVSEAMEGCSERQGTTEEVMVVFL